MSCLGLNGRDFLGKLYGPTIQFKGTTDIMESIKIAKIGLTLKNASKKLNERDVGNKFP